MHDDDDEAMPDPPWLHLLDAANRAWREDQFMKGRNPDSFIESKLRDAGKWPPPKPSIVK